MVPELNIMSEELKNAVLDDESKLEQATQELLKQTENDIEGDFKLEKYNELMNDRKAIFSGGITAAKPIISESKELSSDVSEREQEQEFKDDRRRNTIKNKDYNRVKKLMENYRFLYTHFAAMFYAENRVNDKISSAVDLQRSRSLQKQNLELLKENLPAVIDRSMSEGKNLQQLEDKVDQKAERIDELEDKLEDKKDLESRIEHLEAEVESVEKSLVSNQEVNSAKGSSRSTNEDKGEASQEDDIEEVELDEIKDVVELTDLQSECMDLMIDEDLTSLEEITDEVDRPVGAVKTLMSGIVKKAEDQGLRNSKLSEVIQ